MCLHGLFMVSVMWGFSGASRALAAGEGSLDEVMVLANGLMNLERSRDHLPLIDRPSRLLERVLVVGPSGSHHGAGAQPWRLVRPLPCRDARWTRTRRCGGRAVHLRRARDNG